MMNKLQFHPYKIQINYKLIPRDEPIRVNFCNTVWHDRKDSNVRFCLLMSDEVKFHLYTIVNKQNTRYWAHTNSTEIVQKPLHSPKKTV